MVTNCLDIGTIQAFMDCELTHDESARVSGHIATCDACAMLLAEAEEESAIVFPALEREMNTLVPTQRLWTKINDSIALEKSREPFWIKALGLVKTAFINPQLAFAAGLLIVGGIFVIVLINRGTVTDRPVAKVNAPSASTSQRPQTTSDQSDRIVTPITRQPESRPETAGPQFEKASYRPEPRRVAMPIPTAAASQYLPGEASYVKTIDTLEKNVAQKKDGLLAAPERVAFERDMAIVNDSISKLRKEVKKNPRNESAKQVLYSSYQNKIDLLNSVTQKEELIASLTQ